MSNITWKPVAAIDIAVHEATWVYHDDLPLSDILLAENGAVCCARRVPGLAELLVWPRGFQDPPISWTGPPSLPILRVFAFDGSEAYAYTSNQLLRIRPGAVDVLHAAKSEITGAWLSPDGRNLLWLERSGRKGYVAGMEIPLRATKLQLSDDCYNVRWLSSDEILALELHHEGEAEAGQSLHVCGLDGRIVATAFRTAAFVLQLGPIDPATRTAFVFGNAIAPIRDPGPRRTGAWLYDMKGAELSCVANVAPAGGTAVASFGGCLFADASQQTSNSSRIVFASRAGCRVAPVRGFLRSFELSRARRTVLFRASGDGFGIRELEIDDLVQDGTTTRSSD